jgi:GDPmannose 4,6-dehydratase
MKKVALITGITGQDGSYLAKLLLEKGYEVHGIKRRSSVPTTERIDPFLSSLHIHDGDLTDSGNLFRIIKECEPDEIYNLAAQSDVAVSFASPEYTANTNALGPLRILEAIRILGFEKKTRYYQASTSELYGLVREVPQRETTPFYPRSPYAVSKLYAYWITVNYREAYGLYAANGILFNHESPVRGEQFVTRKITKALGRIAVGLQKDLRLGNLNSKRDWGHAMDSVEMQWLILQQDKPDDYVIASGEEHSVKEFVECAASEIGMKLKWEGEGVHERGILDESFGLLPAGTTLVSVDPRYFRPAEVDRLLGDATKAKEKLKWKTKWSFQALVQEMMRADLKRAEFEKKYSSHN